MYGTHWKTRDHTITLIASDMTWKGANLWFGEGHSRLSGTGVTETGSSANVACTMKKRTSKDVQGVHISLVWKTKIHPGWHTISRTNNSTQAQAPSVLSFRPGPILQVHLRSWGMNLVFGSRGDKYESTWVGCCSKEIVGAFKVVRVRSELRSDLNMIRHIESALCQCAGEFGRAL